ncbi:MAG TPA: hypothetical protein VE870_17775 [Bacteroidales bacterium]|nr:hypothetical protein [Bacteroidales bacterium]
MKAEVYKKDREPEATRAIRLSFSFKPPTMEVRDQREQSSHRHEQNVTNHEGDKAFIFF